MEITDTINYYVEPVEIEIYLKKQGRCELSSKICLLSSLMLNPFPMKPAKNI
jgi:hypothetical protein